MEGVHNEKRQRKCTRRSSGHSQSSIKHNVAFSQRPVNARISHQFHRIVLCLCSTWQRSLLPRSPDPNQAADSPCKPNYSIIKICVTKCRTGDSKIAKVGNELKIRSTPFPENLLSMILWYGGQRLVLHNLLALHNAFSIAFVNALFSLP